MEWLWKSGLWTLKKIYRPQSFTNKIFNICNSGISTTSQCSRKSYKHRNGKDFNSNKSHNSNAVVYGTGLGFILGLSVSYGFYKYLYSPNNKLKKGMDYFDNMPSIPILKTAQVFDPGTASGDLGKGSGDSETPPKPPRVMFNFIADVVEKIAPSVVYVEIKARHPVTNRYVPISNGSGFIISSDGLILTNAHVVANRANVTVKLLDGREFQGFVEDQDHETDLATVRINATNLPVLRLGQSSKLRPGEFVIAMGNPLTLSHTITAGVVSSAHRPSKELGLHQKTDYIQTDAAINVGNSGGPLVNLDGEAIGINTMKVTEGISFAIPSDRAIEFLKRIQNNQKSFSFLGGKRESKAKRQYIGITMLTLTPSLIQELQQRNPEFPNVQSGVMIWKVMLDSPAYDGGIRPGDVIVDINGTPVKSASDVYKSLETDKLLKLKVCRRSNILYLNVKPQDPNYQ